MCSLLGVCRGVEQSKVWIYFNDLFCVACSLQEVTRKETDVTDGEVTDPTQCKVNGDAGEQ